MTDWSTKTKASMFGSRASVRSNGQLQILQEKAIATARRVAKDKWAAGEQESLRWRQSIWRMKYPDSSRTPYDEVLRRQPPLIEAEDPADIPPAYREGFVYLVRCGVFVKIGFTGDVLTRLLTMQTGTPFHLELLASFPGTERHEAELHAQFASLRERGEWFRYEGDLLGYINSIRHAPHA